MEAWSGYPAMKPRLHSPGRHVSTSCQDSGCSGATPLTRNTFRRSSTSKVSFFWLSKLQPEKVASWRVDKVQNKHIPRSADPPEHTFPEFWTRRSGPSQLFSPKSWLAWESIQESGSIWMEIQRSGHYPRIILELIATDRVLSECLHRLHSSSAPKIHAFLLKSHQFTLFFSRTPSSAGQRRSDFQFVHSTGSTIICRFAPNTHHLPFCSKHSPFSNRNPQNQQNAFNTTSNKLSTKTTQ